MPRVELSPTAPVASYRLTTGELIARRLGQPLSDTDRGTNVSLTAVALGTGLTVQDLIDAGYITKFDDAPAPDRPAPLPGLVDESRINVANGVAGLDADVKLDPAVLPDLSALDSEVAAAVAGVTKASLGLGNVDNTSDTAKPVSTAQAAAIAAINGRFRGAWAAATAYKQNDTVLRPSDSALVYANADFTSGGSYSAGNWTALSAESESESAFAPNDGGASNSLTVIISPLDIMPKGLRDDGTDMSAVINAAVTRIAADARVSGRLRLPEGQFSLQANGLICPAGVALTVEGLGGGTILTQDGDIRAMSFGATGSHDAGTDPRQAGTTIVQNVARGATRLYVADNSPFAAKRYVELRSATGATFTTGTGSLGANVPLTEILQVQTTGTDGTGPYVDIYGSVEEDGYLIADVPTSRPAATLLPLTLTEGWAVSNLKIVNSAPDTRTAFSDGVQMRGALESVVEDVRLVSVDEVGVIMWDSVDFSVRNCHARDDGTFVGGVRSTYGFKAEGPCTGGRFDGITARKLRHAFTTGGAPRHITISHGHATETSKGPWDSHAGARFLTYDTCTAERCAGGFGVRAEDVTILNGQVINPTGLGIYIWGRSPSADQRGHRCKVLGGSIINGNTAGVKFVGSDDTIIDGLTVDTIPAGTSAIFVGSDTNGLPGDDPAIVGSDAISNRATVKNCDLLNLGGAGSIGIYYALGDGHRYDNVYVNNAAVGIRAGTLCTNFRHGKLRTSSVTDQVHSDIPASIASPAELVGTGSPEGVNYAPIGSSYTRIDGSGATVHYRKETAPTAKTGWVPRASRPADLGDRRDYRRSSDCSSCHRLDQLTGAAQTTGVLAGAHARNTVAQTYTKARMMTGGTLTALTDCRIGVWSSTGVLLAETANFSASLAINSLIDNIPLLAPLALGLGDDVYLGVGAVGTTFQLFSLNEGLSLFTTLTPANGPTKDTRTATWAGGALVNLSTSVSTRLPWIELIP